MMVYNIPSATKYSIFLYQDQNTTLYVERTMNNRKTGKLYWQRLK